MRGGWADSAGRRTQTSPVPVVAFKRLPEESCSEQRLSYFMVVFLGRVIITICVQACRAAGVINMDVAGSQPPEPGVFKVYSARQHKLLLLLSNKQRSGSVQINAALNH